MKIVRVYPYFQVDLQYSEHYLATALNKLGHTTTFISSNKYTSLFKRYITNEDPEGYYKYKRFDLHRLKSLLLLDKPVLIQLRKLSKLLFNSDVHIIHLYGVATFTTATTLWLHFLAGSKIPILISDHSDSRSHKREGFLAYLNYQFFTLNLHLFFRRINKIISFSQSSVDLISKRHKIPHEKMEVIKLGYDQDNYRFRPDLKNKSTKMIIGYAGKVTPLKRLDFLINTVDKLEISSQIKIIIVGYNESDPYCKSLKELAKNVNFEVEFRPFASSKELVEFYNFIDIAVYPGGVSITTIEASGCGTPVIVYKSIPNLQERVSHNRGLLFDSEEELVEGIKYYFNQQKIGAIENEYIASKTKELFSWEIVSKDYLNLYNSALNGK